MSERGIPTKYAYTRFRSRLEARWARLFDALGWAWEYEPFDLDGYVPDFAILGARPFLVEVKPALTIDELRRHRRAGGKVELATHTRDVLLVGVSPSLPGKTIEMPDGEAVTLKGAGLLAVWHETDSSGGVVDAEVDWTWCHVCHRVGVGGDGVESIDRYAYPCNHAPYPDSIFHAIPYVERVWGDARNKTQWNAQ